MPSSRDRLIAEREILRDRDEPLREIEITVPSLNARAQIARARAMVRAADALLTEALKHPLGELAEGFDDFAPHPDTKGGCGWGPEIVHDGGPKPAWVADDDWTSDTGYDALAGGRVWRNCRTYRLRADHPHYLVAAVEATHAAASAS